MFEPQHLLDLQDSHQTAAGGASDASSWLSGHHTASSAASLHSTLSSLSNAAGGGGNLDPVLFNNLVEIVPLVQSLIDRKANSSFTRRGSVIYTKTPSRESLARKTTDLKARNGAHSIPTKRNKDTSKNLGVEQDGSTDNSSMLPSRSLPTEKDLDELLSLREQVEDLRRKLSEKDELLKSGETLKTEMALIQAKLDEIMAEAVEKDSLLKATQLQLSDTKIKLADKQAAVEKLQWEAMTSNQRVEKLQKDLEVVQGEISSCMLVFEGLIRNTSTPITSDYDAVPCPSDHGSDLDDLNEMEMQKLEAARVAYAAAVAAAKEKQDDESIAAAARARAHLQSFVIQPTI